MYLVSPIWCATEANREAGGLAGSEEFGRGDRSPQLCLNPVDSSTPLGFTALEREFFIDNLLVRVHRCFWCTGLAPWEFESLPYSVGQLYATRVDSSTSLRLTALPLSG